MQRATIEHLLLPMEYDAKDVEEAEKECQDQ